MAHKDCPVSQAQGLNSAAMNSILEGPGAANPMAANMLGVTGAPPNVGMVGMTMPGPYGMGAVPNGMNMGMMGVAGGNPAGVQRKYVDPVHPHPAPPVAPPPAVANMDAASSM